MDAVVADGVKVHVIPFCVIAGRTVAPLMVIDAVRAKPGLDSTLKSQVLPLMPELLLEIKSHDAEDFGLAAQGVFCSFTVK